MPRTARLLPLLAVALLLVPVGLSHARENEAGGGSGKTFEDLDSRVQRDLAEVARNYFDPEVEFLWRPRKDFQTALVGLADQGIEALEDLDFLLSVIYQGRHFLPRFEDRGWQRDAGVDFKKVASVYLNVISEEIRLTYCLPRRYPDENRLEKRIPREAPFPLLLSLHEEQDDLAGPMAGTEVLQRRYPRSSHGALYEDWILLAPWAARGKFLEDDGAIRHRFLTVVLRDVWQRYHVDFDQIVLDGTDGAVAFAAAYPHILAGLVLRSGPVAPEIVPNFAHVPVFVPGDDALAAALREAGHPDVTAGSDAELLDWLDARRRVTARDFTWRMLHPDHQLANWVNLVSVDWSAPERGFRLACLDTESDPNTIRIDARGVFILTLFLNDRLVDLDREVRLVINGQEQVLGVLERDFGQFFEKDPKIRDGMYFGWLYPTYVPQIRVPAPAPEAPPPEEAPPGPSEETPPPDEEEPAVEGSAADERKASVLWDKAVAAEEEGDVDTARRLYQAVIDIGVTSYRSRARARLAGLGG